MSLLFQTRISDVEWVAKRMRSQTRCSACGVEADRQGAPQRSDPTPPSNYFFLFNSALNWGGVG
jgi:hypothetical protein